MRTIFLIFLFTFAIIRAVVAQPSDSAKTNLVSQYRVMLTEALNQGVSADINKFTDELMALENDSTMALVWDERWLLYFRSGSFGNLFEEIISFESVQATNTRKKRPANDSLFQVLDALLLEERFGVYSQIQNAMLNTEEKALATLVLEYLLRLNTGTSDWEDRVRAFVKKYPDTRFLPYLKSLNVNLYPSVITIETEPFIPKIKFAGMAALTQYFWTDNAQRIFGEHTGFYGELTIWKRKWNYTGAFHASSPRLQYDILRNNDVWPKGSKALLRSFEFSIGRDLWNNKTLRLTSSVGLGYSNVYAPVEDDGFTPYEDFDTGSLHPIGAISLDLKRVFNQKPKAWDDNYYGIRAKWGIHGTQFDDKLPTAKGYMLFFSIGICFWAG